MAEAKPEGSTYKIARLLYRDTNKPATLGKIDVQRTNRNAISSLKANLLKAFSDCASITNVLFDATTILSRTCS